MQWINSYMFVSLSPPLWFFFCIKGVKLWALVSFTWTKPSLFEFYFPVSSFPPFDTCCHVTLFIQWEAWFQSEKQTNVKNPTCSEKLWFHFFCLLFLWIWEKPAAFSCVFMMKSWRAAATKTCSEAFTVKPVSIY